MTEYETNDPERPFDPMDEVVALLSQIDRYADDVKRRVAELKERANGG